MPARLDQDDRLAHPRRLDRRRDAARRAAVDDHVVGDLAAPGLGSAPNGRGESTALRSGAIPTKQTAIAAQKMRRFIKAAPELLVRIWLG